MRGLRPLSLDIQALLASSRAVLPLAPSVQARALARAAAAVSPPELAAVRSPPRPRWVFAAAAGLVIAFGAAAYAARAWFDGRPSPMSAHVAPVAPRGPAAPPLASAVAVVRESDARAPLAPPMKPVRAKSGVAAVRPTNAELQLLLSARRDVTQRDFAGALVVIAEHTRRFRNGSLVEEREALRVKSLAGLGRHADAQRAATRFHERFPRSVLLSTFERITEADR